MRPKINRLDARFAQLKNEGKKAFIAFATAGYPSLDLYPQLLCRLPEVGADIIEIGMPFSDPVADGEPIQRANLHALKAGITVKKTLAYVGQFREQDDQTPIVLMGYYNPIYSYGIMRFLDEAQKLGVDGFIIPDLPPEEDEEFRIPAAERDMYQIRLVTPTTDEKRLPKVLKGAKGFLYYVSMTGVTGVTSCQTPDPTLSKQAIQRIRASSSLPIAVGFGNNTPQRVRQKAEMGDGVIVGSSIMTRIQSHIQPNGQINKEMLEDVLAYIKTLADAAHSAS